MESRIQRIFLITGLCITLLPASFVVAEEQVIQPEVDRREITIADIDTEDFEIGLFAGALNIEDFGTSGVYGIRAAYHITEDFFVEAAAGTSEASQSSFEKLSGGATLIADGGRDLTYYNVSVGYNLLPGEAFLGSNLALNTTFYVIAGIGSTEFGTNDNFTVNAGVGYRVLASDWLSFRVEMRDHMFESDLLGSNELTHNLELTGSFTLFF